MAIISTTACSSRRSSRRNGVAIIVKKSPKCSSVQFSLVPQLCLTLCDPMNLSMPGQNAVLGCNLKNDRMISVCFQGRPFTITVIQVYAQTNNAEEAEVEWFYEDLQDLLELIPKEDVLFIIEEWNTKVGSPEIPWHTE